MNPARGTPPPGAVGALLAAIGLGIACWYGWAWYHVPKWSEKEIAASVELNLALDLSRLPPNSVPQETQERMRAQIRREVEAQIAKESEGPRSWTLAGLLIGVFGLVQMVLRTWLARRAPRP
jgi:hypothetical protein